MKINAMVLVTCVTMLAACQTTYAQRPIRMAPAAMQYFADWAAIPHAKAFAVSENGRAVGIVYCPEFGGCAGPSESTAISICEANSKGVPCLIYGVDGKPVLDDPKLQAYLETHKGDRSKIR